MCWVHYSCKKLHWLQCPCFQGLFSVLAHFFEALYSDVAACVAWGGISTHVRSFFIYIFVLPGKLNLDQPQNFQYDNVDDTPLGKCLHDQMSFAIHRYSSKVWCVTDQLAQRYWSVRIAGTQLDRGENYSCVPVILTDQFHGSISWIIHHGLFMVH